MSRGYLDSAGSKFEYHCNPRNCVNIHYLLNISVLVNIEEAEVCWHQNQNLLNYFILITLAQFTDSVNFPIVLKCYIDVLMQLRCPLVLGGLPDIIINKT